jgi:enoyl-[acyl-carrier protein] reductase I
MTASPTATKVALIMGVSNQRSIAWSCTQSFLDRGWQVILSYQNPSIQAKVESMVFKNKNKSDQVLGGFACDVTCTSQVEEEMPQRLADILQDRPLYSVVHSLAHAPNLKTTSLLKASIKDYSEAHEISAYSLISVARATQPIFESNDNIGSNSITALSYLGAVRAIPGYNVMGPAKASLEAIVRGLAAEMAPSTRVNAVSAGPIATISAKGGIANFSNIQSYIKQKAPLGNVTAEQVASAIQFLACEGTGITGQTLYVDGGYSIVGGPSAVDC